MKTTNIMLNETWLNGLYENNDEINTSLGYVSISETENTESYFFDGDDGWECYKRNPSNMAVRKLYTTRITKFMEIQNAMKNNTNQSHCATLNGTATLLGNQKAKRKNGWANVQPEFGS